MFVVVIYNFLAICRVWRVFWALTIFLVLITLVKAVFVIDVADERKFKFKLKRISKNKQKDKVNFISNLNNMISNTQTLQNITKNQIAIKIGYTQVDWKSVAG
ncbi:MAG: hypothetical protein K2I80_06585 [Ruminococcus sp.]|nr:hypothetical protein [Ruminococcus sp.]